MEDYFDEEDEIYKEETRTYSITGMGRCLDELERMFKLMAASGDSGMMMRFKVFYDGDGYAHLKITRTDDGFEFNTFENEDEVDKMIDEAVENDKDIEFSLD